MSGALSNLKSELTTWLTSLGSSQVSPEFFELIKGIGEAKSKQEEAMIIEREAALLKANMSKPENEKRMKEYVIRALYCEMLGYPVPFAYIHALNMTQRVKLIDKRVGYLFAALCLHENHELMMLLINSFRRDLESPNILEVSASLTSMAWLLSAETVPAVVDVVKTKITHHHEIVRKKCVMVIHRCIQRMPEIASEVDEVLRRALCDKDASVMAASLHSFSLIIRLKEENPSLQMPDLKNLVPSFVSILKQIIERRLDKDFEYHKAPAPWMQVGLLKILGVLGRDDKSTSQHMYEVLGEALRRGDNGSNSGYAIVYECVRTICSIFPHKPLLDAAAESISQFIASHNNNLKYLGLTLLAQIVQINPLYAIQHQIHVINCLEDPDESIQRKTLTLLYRMTNPKNVTVVAEKLVDYLKKSHDAFLRAELVSKITMLAEKYAVNNSWFVNTMNKVFLLGGDLVRAEVANNLMRLLAEGAGGDENADNELRAQAVQSYIALCQQPVLPDILVKVIAWVLGEYAYLALEDVNQAIDSLCDLMDRPYKNSDVKNWLCWAIGKLLAYTGELRDDVKDMLMKYAICDNVELSRRCQELIVLFDVLQTATSRDVREDLNAIFPIDASCEDINVEVSIGEVVRYLSEKAVMEGGRQYVPKAKRGGAFGKVSTTVLAGGASAGGSKKLRFKYDHPAPKPAVTHIMANSPDRVEPARVSDAPAPIVTTPGKSVMSAAGPWGKTGYGLPKPTTPAAVPGAEGTYKSPTVPNHEQSPQETAYYEAAKKSAPAASPPPKVVDTKQQQLAAQLFMGLGDEVATTTSPTATVVVRKAAPLPVRSNSGTALASTRAGIARQSSAPLASPAVSDLLGGLSVSDESESHHPQPAVDLLGLDFSSAPSSSPSSPTATNVRTGSPAPPRDLLSSFDDDEVVTPSSFPAQQHSNTILSPTPGVPEFLKPAFVAARQISGTDPDNFDIENLTKTSLLTSFSDQPRSHEKNQVAVKDANLNVSFVRVWSEDETSILIFFGNKSASKDLTNVSATFTAPAGVPTNYSGDSIVNVQGNTITIPIINPASAIVATASVQYAGQLQPTLYLQSTVQYSYLNQVKSLRCNIPIDFRDFIRPVQMKVERYGSLWAKHPMEAQLRITNCTARSVDEVKAKLARLNISTVQIIKNEAVAAARVLKHATGSTTHAEPEGELLLVHAKVDLSTKAVDFKFRAKNKMISDMASRFVSITMTDSAAN